MAGLQSMLGSPRGLGQGVPSWLWANPDALTTLCFNSLLAPSPTPALDPEPGEEPGGTVLTALGWGHQSGSRPHSGIDLLCGLQ